MVTYRFGNGDIGLGMFHPSARACLQKQGMEKMAKK
jgi:hypothetical protein